MTTSAVIVTYQTPPEQLRLCQASLRRSGVDQNIIIANNPRHNKGFAAAANIGAKQASTDALLFINPDAILSDGAFKQALNYLATHPTCGIVGLMLTSSQGNPEQHSFGRPVTPISLFTRHLIKPGGPSKPTSVGWVSGGAMLVRRQTFQQLNGFDSRFFLYWEDVDLCRRARQAGWQVVILPKATVIHQRGASLTDNKLKTKLFDISADKYFCKHYPKPICQFLRFLRSLYRRFSPQVH